MENEKLNYTEWIEDIPVHPYAATYPMMSGEELQELADDIKANGQREPIVMAHMNGIHDDLVVVIDGRNRYAACKLAGVEPEFRTDFLLSGDAIGPWIDSKNLHRRHLSRDQRRAVIERALRANPELPDYQIAKRTRTSPHTVKRVREETPDLQNANERVNARGQKRPATYDRAPGFKPGDLDEINQNTPAKAQSPDEARYVKPPVAQIEPPQDEPGAVLRARHHTDEIRSILRPGADEDNTVLYVLLDEWIIRAILLGSLTPVEAVASAQRFHDGQLADNVDDHSLDTFVRGLLTRTGRWIGAFNPDIPLSESFAQE